MSKITGTGRHIFQERSMIMPWLKQYKKSIYTDGKYTSRSGTYCSRPRPHRSGPVFGPIFLPLLLALTTAAPSVPVLKPVHAVSAAEVENSNDAENRDEAESETETETEAAPDPRSLWYNEHVASMPFTELPEKNEKVSFRLAQLAESDRQTREQRLGAIRVELAAFLYRQYGVILSEVYGIHYVCTDTVDYALIYVGDTDYICRIDYSDPEEWKDPSVTDADIDDWTLSALRSITGGCSGDMAVRYWNGYIPFDIQNPDGSGTNAAQAGLAVDPASLLHMNTAELENLPEQTAGGLIPAVPYFNQGLGYWNGLEWTHTEWPDKTFTLNGHTMHEAGCGFFAAAMAISYFRQEIVPPTDFMENGQYIGDGSAVTVSLESAGMYEVPAVITGSWDEAYAALQAGHIVMENVGPGVFARYGHYIMLTGILDNGQIVINDPGNEYHTYWYTWETFDAETCRDNRHDDSTAFTIFG